MKKFIWLIIIFTLAGCATNRPPTPTTLTNVSYKSGVLSPTCYKPQDRCFVDPCFPDRLVCVRYWYDKNNEIQLFQPFYKEMSVTIEPFQTSKLCESGGVSFSDPCTGGEIDIFYWYSADGEITTTFWFMYQKIQTGLLYAKF